MVALAGMTRNVAAAISAAIIDELVENMGIGWCFTGLALLDVICIAGVVFIMIKGPANRKKLMAS